MPISAKATYNAALLDDLLAYADGFNAQAFALANEVVDAIEPYVIGNLSQPIPSVARPIEWESRKQQQAYWASDGFGAGIPYRRTDETRNAWYLNRQLSAAELAIEIGNSKDHAQFVYGSLNQRSRPEAARFQQKMHRNTGYPLAVDIINPALETIHDQYLGTLRKQYHTDITTIVKRRSKRR